MNQPTLLSFAKPLSAEQSNLYFRLVTDQNLNQQCQSLMDIIIISKQRLMGQTLQASLGSLPELNCIETHQYLRPPSYKIKTGPILCAYVTAINELLLLASYKSYYGPSAKLLVLSPLSNSQVITRAIEAGAHGFVSIDSSLEDLREAVCQVYSGKRYLAKNVHKAVLEGMFDQNVNASTKLTYKENQILQMTCGGSTTREIASNLNLSLNTVRSYCSRLMKKFQVNRTIDLIIYAIKHGIHTP